MERSTILLMGKSTISTGPFSIVMLNYQRAYPYWLISSQLFRLFSSLKNPWISIKIHEYPYIIIYYYPLKRGISNQILSWSPNSVARMDVLRMEIQLTEIHCNAAISVTWFSSTKKRMGPPWKKTNWFMDVNLVDLTNYIMLDGL